MHVEYRKPSVHYVCVYGLFCDYKLKSLHVNRCFAINNSLAASGNGGNSSSSDDGARMHGRQRTRNAGCNKSTTNKYISSAWNTNRQRNYSRCTKLHAKFATRVLKTKKEDNEACVEDETEVNSNQTREKKLKKNEAKNETQKCFLFADGAYCVECRV